uniref:PAN-3 domain-containing protein n=2 Tax=Caenorhabditis japonica TaxID=281687 RepID=A0A8R1DF62_CAEJA
MLQNISFICLFILSSAVTADQKMIEMYGTAKIYNKTAYETYGSWNECLVKCYSNEMCMLVYQAVEREDCWLFRFGNVTAVKKASNGDKVAFKRTLNTTTFPSNPEPPLFGALSDTTIFNGIFCAVTADQKMIEMYGTAKIYNKTAYETYGSWNECLVKCYSNEMCMLVYQAVEREDCWLFRFGNVTAVKKASNGDKVAFKRTLNTTTCPSNPDPPLFGALSDTTSWTTGQTGFIYTLTADSNSSWTFSYTTFTCPIGSQPFARGNNGVCMQILRFPASASGNHAQASELCKQGNATSLTGPASEAELEWILNTVRTTQKSVSVWFDGESLYEPKEFVMEDSSHNGVDFYGMKAPNPDDEQIHACLYLCESPRASGGVCLVKPTVE